MFTNISTISAALVGQTVKIRARIFRTRILSKIVFIVLRQEMDTIQCIIDRASFDGKIVNESIVDVVATVQAVKVPVKSCTVKDVELTIQSIEIVSLSQVVPIQIDEPIYLPNNSDEIATKLDTRLNNRVLDLRKIDNHFIFRVQAEISKIIRNFYDDNGFVEIHSPKLIGAASEGGANVFEVAYFNRKAYLAQSPQLYKQMVICADFPRVYEIGPVFRAESSFTHRHLTEFTGIDMEMTFEQDYHEILDLYHHLFITLFTQLLLKFGNQIDAFSKEYGVEPFVFSWSNVCITFQEAVALLREAGIEMGDYEDFNTEKEKALGRIIKAKYNTDFFMVDQFPTEVRPFYTKPNPANPKYSNSYDFFMRGEEVLSGAERINDYATLVESAISHEIDVNTIADYLEAFKYGVPKHGGGGIGLERVVMLYLGINNIRNVSLFPRDPTRLTA